MISLSNGWLVSWRKRFGVKAAILSGESADVDVSLVTEWRGRLREILKGYSLETSLMQIKLAFSSSLCHLDYLW